jgi:RimJ/RimL family protein N-acetyltransferase
MYEHKTGIRYRKVTQNDSTDLYRLKAESWWGTHTTPVMNHLDQFNWINGLDDKETLVMIAEAEVGPAMKSRWEEVGVGVYSNFDWIGRTCNISGSIYKEHRKKHSKNAFQCGLDFGFEILNMQRIQAEVLEYNIAAQKLEVEELGFTVEGRRRKAVYKAGQYYDSIMLGMLRVEWGATVYARYDTGTPHPSCNNNVDHNKLIDDAIQARADLGSK